MPVEDYYYIKGSKHLNHLLMAHAILNLYACVSSVEHKEDILKKVCVFVHTIKVSELQCCLDPNIFQNVSYFVP